VFSRSNVTRLADRLQTVGLVARATARAKPGRWLNPFNA